jgi:hypothetical protein
MDYARTETNPVGANVVLLVDGVGRSALHDLGPRRVLPAAVDFEVPEEQQRVVMQGDGCRVITKVATFDRTPGEFWTDTGAREISIAVYRLRGFGGRPPVRRGYR